jgi:peptide-methionine (S)-S-oxide reductase
VGQDFAREEFMLGFDRSMKRLMVAAVVMAASLSFAKSAPIPAPELDAPKTAGAAPQKAVFAGGCFWGIQAVFQRVKGVQTAVSGYSGGEAKTADYHQVSSGETGHAESVEVTYDPAQISYGQLLQIFFSVAHDPTELNRQGPDEGTQYRSAIFYANNEQHTIADAYIAQLEKLKIFPSRIVTAVTPLKAFYPAEAYHQDYFSRHPNNPYIVYNDAPKVENLKRDFPSIYKAQ